MRLTLPPPPPLPLLPLLLALNSVQLRAILSTHARTRERRCKYESYLSMQMPTPAGMVSMDQHDVRARFRMALVDSRDPPSLNTVLMDTWLAYTGDDVEEVIGPSSDHPSSSDGSPRMRP